MYELCRDVIIRYEREYAQTASHITLFHYIGTDGTYLVYMQASRKVQCIICDLHHYIYTYLYYHAIYASLCVGDLTQSRMTRAFDAHNLFHIIFISLFAWFFLRTTDPKPGSIASKRITL